MPRQELRAYIGANAEQFHRTMRGVEGTVRNFGAVIGTYLSGYAARFAATAAFKPTIDLELWEFQIKALTGSADYAREVIKKLSDFSVNTPFEIPGIVNAYKLLLQFTGGLLSTEDGLRMVGDAAAAAGEEIDTVAYWTGRLFSGLKAGAAWIDAVSALQRMKIVPGSIRPQLEQMARANASFAEMWAVVEGVMRDKAGAMDELGTTVQGRIRALSDVYRTARAEFGEPVRDELRRELQHLIDVIQDLRKSGKLENWGRETSEVLNRLFTVLEKVVSFLVANGDWLKFAGVSMAGTAAIGKLISMFTRLRTVIMQIAAVDAFGATTRGARTLALGLQGMNISAQQRAMANARIEPGARSVLMTNAPKASAAQADAARAMQVSAASLGKAVAQFAAASVALAGAVYVAKIAFDLVAENARNERLMRDLGVTQEGGGAWREGLKAYLTSMVGRGGDGFFRGDGNYDAGNLRTNAIGNAMTETAMRERSRKALQELATATAEATISLQQLNDRLATTRTAIDASQSDIAKGTTEHNLKLQFGDAASMVMLQNTIAELKDLQTALMPVVTGYDELQRQHDELAKQQSLLESAFDPKGVKNYEVAIAAVNKKLEEFGQGLGGLAVEDVGKVGNATFGMDIQTQEKLIVLLKQRKALMDELANVRLLDETNSQQIEQLQGQIQLLNRAMQELADSWLDPSKYRFGMEEALNREAEAWARIRDLIAEVQTQQRALLQERERLFENLAKQQEAANREAAKNDFKDAIDKANASLDRANDKVRDLERSVADMIGGNYDAERMLNLADDPRARRRQAERFELRESTEAKLSRLQRGERVRFSKDEKRELERTARKQERLESARDRADKLQQNLAKAQERLAARLEQWAEMDRSAAIAETNQKIANNTGLLNQTNNLLGQLMGNGGLG